ncbi:MAG TPA: class I SAM-dependent methyltransferase [Phycisphaerales bacterium]|nr:class I SAM-dependent methyltransferase [Phycisphaerales bacterium]
MSDPNQPSGPLPASATPRIVPTTKRSTLTPDYQRDWPQYFDAVKDQPPRDTCLRALAAFASEPLPPTGKRQAIDIATGEGRDTRAVLASAAHWHVIATDSSAEGLRRLQTSLELAPTWPARVRCAEVTMEDLPAWCSRESIHTAHLINASFALPFCQPEQFPDLWSWITHTLVPGGRFAGQFFGDRDEWACVRPKSHLTKQQVLTLLHNFDIEHFEEVEKEGSDAMGGTKWHHVFHVVARKRP